jgi:hypothetical protein
MDSKIQKKTDALIRAKATHDKGQTKEVIIDKALSFNRRSSASIPSPAQNKPLKRKSSSQIVDLGTILPTMAIPRKKKEKPESIPLAKPADVFGQPSQVSTVVRRGRQWGRKTKDRYAELDPSIAVAVNAGDRPTLKNSRKELAAQKSKVTVDMIQLVLTDLLEKIKKTSDRVELNATIKGRKLFWKREFSELTKEDFKEIWDEVKRKYTLVRNGKSNNNDPPSQSVDADSSIVDRSVVDRNVVDRNVADSNVADRTVIDRNVADRTVIDRNVADRTVVDRNVADRTVVDRNVGDRNVVDDGHVPQVVPIFDANEESAIATNVCQEEPPKPYHDRWSHLFVGPSFRMGNEFTLDEFEEYV